MMLTHHSVAAIQGSLKVLRSAGKSIGFVPTMGALHQGHLSLIAAAQESCDSVVVSVFVNPTQFNDPRDFNRYPRYLDNDLKMLESVGCDMAFVPDQLEMYPVPDTHPYCFGTLEKVMEGAHRKGHFNGVGMVVRRFFEIIRPDQAFFGEKDYQQLLIIRMLNRQFNLGVEVVACPILREKNGLAMSSRNALLQADEREKAGIILQALKQAKACLNSFSIRKAKQHAIQMLEATPGLKVEYFEIADAETLESVEVKNDRPMRGFVAVNLGHVRLIDNLAL